MLNRVEVSNFQSLHSLDIELAAFTVIVGRSSSGKSAFTRALRLLASNQRGSAFITHGERQCRVTAHTDRGVVSIARGADDSYTVIPHDGQQRTYSKLGGNTPPEVSSFLGIPSTSPLNFAGQFDMPYLLKDSAGEVARTLGALTNVNVIFEAAQQSNRKRTQVNASLKVKQADLATITEQRKQYEPLPAQLRALTAAEEALTRAHTTEQYLARLQGLTALIDGAESKLSSLPTVTALPSIEGAAQIMKRQRTLEGIRLAHSTALAILQKLPTVTTLPSIDVATQQQATLTRLRNLSQQHATAYEGYLTARELMDHTTQQTAALTQQYTDTLAAAGTCPTCHQSTEGLPTHAHA